MRKTPILAALLAACFLSGAAHADIHRYLKPNGNNNFTGGTVDSAWATMAYANANLPQPNTANGNVWLHVLAGDYNPGSFPNPVNVPADGKRYFIVGPKLADPGLVLFPGGTLTKTYVSITGVTFQGTMSLSSAARFDSLSYCLIEGNQSWGGSDDCVIYRSTITGGHFDTGLNGTGVCIRNVMESCLLNLAASDGNKLFTTGYNFVSPNEARVDSARFSRNRINLTITGCAGGPEFFPRYHFLTAHSLFEYNRWDIVNLGTSCGDRVWRFRDSCYTNMMNGDTVIAVSGDFSHAYMSSVTANEGGGIPRDTSNYDNDWDSCLVVTMADINWQQGCKRDTITRNVFMCNRLIVENGPIRGSVFEHNTFIGIGDNQFGVLTFALNDASKFGTDTTKVYSNIIASLVPGFIDASFDSDHHTNAGLYAGKKGNVSNYEYWLKTNWNLYSVWANRGTGGDRSCAWGNFGNSSRPGPTSDNAFKATFPANRRGDGDSLSTWGTARFAGGTMDSTWLGECGYTDPDCIISWAVAMAHMGPGNHGTGNGKDGTDCGAVAYLGPPVFQSTAEQGAFLRYHRVMGHPEHNEPMDPLTFSVTNGGSDPLIITAGPSSHPWVKVTVNDASIPSGETGTFTIGPDVIPQDYAYTYKTGSVTLHTNDPSRPTVSVLWYLSQYAVEF